MELSKPSKGLRSRLNVLEQCLPLLQLDLSRPRHRYKMKRKRSMSKSNFMSNPVFPQLEPQVQVQQNYPLRQAWNAPVGKDWRVGNSPGPVQGPVSSNIPVEDIQRALGNLDIAQHSTQPPRFTGLQPPVQPAHLRGSPSSPQLRQDQPSGEFRASPQPFGGANQFAGSSGTGTPMTTQNVGFQSGGHSSRPSVSSIGDDNSTHGADRNFHTRPPNPPPLSMASSAILSPTQPI